MQLDLAVSAPVRVFVRGRGVDAELGGRFTVRGSPARPVVDGALDLKRGALDLFGTRLNFTRGRLTFPGKLDPTLDFVAETQSQDVVATVTISGSASDPKFAFTSTPALPQDEILARILFGQPTTELTKSEAIRLAQAAAQLSGAGGSGLLDRVRKKLGVDVLDIGTSAQGAPQVTVGRRISRHVNVGVSQGTDPTSSRGRVSIDITRNLKLQGEVGADGSTSLGIGAEWNY
jgi:translocation and assembly module TamB